MANRTKFNEYIDPDTLPTFLREMADAIEQGGTERFECVDDLRKFKLEGKVEFGQMKIKGKFKSDKECASEEITREGESTAPAKPKYKDLKKRMRSSFKLLLKTIHDGVMPPEEAVVSFLEDSELMVSYPGYGDEFYASYTEACEAFKAAYEAKDLDKMHETIDVLIHEKSRCHAKYD